jgi:uncharacterized protein
MFDKFYYFCHNFISRHKLLVSALIGIVIFFSIINLSRIKYDNNIETMLPDNQDILRDMRFLRESGFSDKVVINLKLKDDKHSKQDLILAVDQLTASIKSPLIAQVISNVPGNNVISEMVSFLKYTPQLLGLESFSKIASQITPDDVKKRLKFIYRQSLTPGGSFMMPFLREDPLGLSTEILRNIEKLSTSLGYNVVIDNGHLLSRDGHYAMVILKTSVIVTEGFEARKLIMNLREELKKLPDYICVDIIAGHMHTVSNEDVIKKDIRLTSIIASLAFLILFLFFFRDLRAVLIFLIPLAAVPISINITYFVFKKLSYFVIGMGTVIAGIAIDYAIYVYIAVRKAGGSQDTVRQVIRPVIFGALTTVSVFVVFFFSSVKGYRQLACFSSFSIMLCLIFTLSILPHFLSKQRNDPQIPVAGKLMRFFSFKVQDRILIFVWIVMMATMIILAKGLRVNNDIEQCDGVAKEVLLAEEEFHNAWGGKILPAVFVVAGKNLEKAYQVNSDVYEAAIKNIGKENFTSFSSVWPGLNTRKVNELRWQKFWSEAKENEVRKMLIDYGKVYNFSEDAFQPFFAQLHQLVDLEIEPKGLSFFEHLKEQFVLKKENGYQILSFFPDQDKYITRLSTISKNYPRTFLVSRKNFSNEISHALSSELIFLSLLSASLTVGLTFLLLKDIQLSTLALVPVLTSIIMIAGIIPLAGLALNMPIIIASMVVVGIVSDYGMFVVYNCKYKFKTGTYLAVAFAALTTLIGTGVLLFARHPILFSIGVTLTTGVLSGYLSSVIIIPPLYKLWIKERN